jgi:hypothetical protein
MRRIMATLAEVGQDCTEIEDTCGSARIEWADSNPMIIWQESLRFHTERLDEGESFPLWNGFPGIVESELQRLLGSDFACSVRWSDWDETDGFDWLEFSVWPVLDLNPEMAQEGAFNDHLWPAIATLFNVTDPGTFGSEYLFANLAERDAQD